MKLANANEYPQNACGVLVNVLNINQLPPPFIYTSLVFRNYKYCAAMLKLSAFACIVHIVPTEYCGLFRLI